LAGMTANPNGRKTRHFGISKLAVRLQFAQHMMEAAAQNHGQPGPKTGQLLQPGGGGTRVRLFHSSCARRGLIYPPSLIGLVACSDFMELNNDEIRRYSRHLILPEVGLSGQKKICSTSVLCIGAGGLGSPIAMYLAAAGVGKLGILDFDAVDFSNL